MHDLNEGQKPHQWRLIQSLQHKVNVHQIPKPKLEVPPKPAFTHCGRGSRDDYLRIMRNYVCACGTKTSGFEHSSKPHDTQMILDQYRTVCRGCGDEYKVSFVSLKTVLQQV